MENIVERLEKVLGKKNANYLTLSQFCENMGAPLKKNLGIKKGDAANKILERLRPHLGERLKFKTVNKKHYVVLTLSAEELLLRIVRARAGRTAGQTGVNIPFTKTDFREGMNRLLKNGKVRVELSGDKFTPKLYPIGDPALSTAITPTPPATIAPVTPPVSNPPVPVPTPPPHDEAAFHAAYEDLERGRASVRICELRRKLNWPREEFDNMLKSLRDARKIEMQTGNVETMTGQDINESFTDKNGFLMLTLRWKTS